MKLTRTLGTAGIALGLTLAGAGVASAAQGGGAWSPLPWAQQTSTTDATDDSPDTADGATAVERGRGAGGAGSHPARGEGAGGMGEGSMREGATGDPSTCPYADDDATTDQDRDQQRLRERDDQATPGGDGTRQRDRVHTTS